MLVYKYALVPLAGWLTAGTLKFCINYLRFSRQAVGLIGNGGFPSNHTTIVSSTAFLIGLGEGFDTPAFGLGMAILMITVIDAMGIRRAVGRQAQVMNRQGLTGSAPLRERQGHTPLEVAGGLLTGWAVAWGLHIFIG